MKYLHFTLAVLILLIGSFSAIIAQDDDDHDHTHDIMPPFVPIEDYADLPEGALGVEIDPDKGYFVEEFNNGIYWLTEGTYQIMFAVTGEGVIVVDAPPTIGSNVLNGIAEVTDEPITHVIYSHSHIDHIGSASMYADDVTIIAHELVAERLERANDPNRPVPTITFSDTYTLEVGDITLELIYPGNNHEPGNIMIWAPEQRIMTFIDVIFPGWMPWRQLAVSEDIVGYFAVTELLLEYDFEYLVAGHVGRPGTRTDVELQLEFMNDLRAAALEGLQTVDLMAIIGEMQPEDTSNPWAVFDGYIDAVVQHCVDTMTPEWATVLGGFDVFIYDQCQTMEQSIRING